MIDFQNDFVSKDGALHISSTNADFVERAAKLATGFHDIGLVVWVQSVFEKPRQFIESQQIITQDKLLPPSAAQTIKPGRDQSIDPEAFLSTTTAACVQRGTPGWQLANPLKAVVNPKKDVLIMKTQYSAFNGTKLIQILRSKLVTTLYVCGSLVNVGVHATTVDAAAHGYSIILVRDCCGWSNEARREVAIASLTDVSGCEVVNARAIVKSIGGADEGKEEKKAEEKKSKELDKKAKVANEKGREKEVRKEKGKEKEKEKEKEKGKNEDERTTKPEPKDTARAPPLRPSQTRGKLSQRIAALKEKFARELESSTHEEDDSLDIEADPDLEASSDNSEDDFQPTVKRAATSRARTVNQKASETSKPAKEITKEMKKLSLSSPTSKSESGKNRPVNVTERASVVLPSKDAAASASQAPQSNDTSNDKNNIAIAGIDKKLPEDGVKNNKNETSSDVVPVRSPDLPSTAPPEIASPTKENLLTKPIPSKMAPVKNDPATLSSKSPKKPGTSQLAVKPEERANADGATLKNESEPLCEGDTKVIYDILPEDLEAGIFEKVKDEVDWKHMSHLGGEVPRLVAVQGHVEPDGSMPIYRHPADESPPLKPFSPTILRLKEEVEKHLGHTVNHVLIQLYRGGKDYISEHSDKTLDIVKDSYIANLSLGAERTMVFRTKRPEKEPKSPTESESSPPKSPPASTKRQVQRAKLPHNSLCRMGLKTNERWLHAIRQDKRPDFEKTPEELSFGGERISLTFRSIGTFLNADETHIWGQGATAKTKAEARPVINGDEGESERIVRAFGVENRLSEFDWEKHYGQGFDVLHMTRHA